MTGDGKSVISTAVAGGRTNSQAHLLTDGLTLPFEILLIKKKPSCTLPRLRGGLSRLMVNSQKVASAGGNHILILLPPTHALRPATRLHASSLISIGVRVRSFSISGCAKARIYEHVAYPICGPPDGLMEHKCSSFLMTIKYRIRKGRQTTEYEQGNAVAE